MIQYEDFLKRKVKLAKSTGFEIDINEINAALKPHNRLMVKWNIEGGRRANFASFGLHKTVTQLETIRIILTRTGGRGLIIAPLNVRLEFINDAKNILGWQVLPKFIRSIDECEETGIYITNYDTVRDGKLDPRLFQAASLDEASALRGGGSSKTFREFMRLFTGDGGPLGNRRGTECVPYRFVATATPSPNDYIELLLYADFLGIMDISQAKTRFFKRDSTKADKLTLHAHKEREFWLWVASWALFVQKPSDLTGNPTDDEGYILPDLDLRWHELPTDHSDAGVEKSGQIRMYKDVALGLTGAAKEKRDSLPDRIAKLMELRAEDPDAHRIIWHDLESERQAIEKAIPTCATVYGSQLLEKREDIVTAFAYGQIQELAAKPCMLGSGTNLQRHCHWAIYLGIGFKFNDFIQSIHRLLRFLQQHQVRIDLIYTEAEREVRKILETKWKNHIKQVQVMTDIIKEFGLSQAAMANLLTRKIGVERIEIKGDRYRIVNNDCVLEARRLESNSVGLFFTSIPFATQYEYSPNYSDFGHSENNYEFFEQMDYLTPEMYRSLMPGRIAAIHVKDRIMPIGLAGRGTQTSYPFHKEVIEHFTTCPECRLRIAISKARHKTNIKPCNHRFDYMGMKTIVTDVVRENNQTYRLGWGEQCKDGSKMGVGMPEYLLLFRKPPTDTSNSYADIPVMKEQTDSIDKNGNRIPYDRDLPTAFPINPSQYSLSRWQVDAHGFARSSGDRLLTPAEIASLDHAKIFKVFKDYSLNNIYEFEYHVAIGDALEASGKLPTTFMLLQPQSWSDEVWTDITRMRTLNSSQYSKGKEMHLCPMQIDLAQRVIRQLSNEGDTVVDPFGGIMTVPSISVKLGRYGVAFELNNNYFLDGAAYCKAAEDNVKMPTLFDL